MLSTTPATSPELGSDRIHDVDRGDSAGLAARSPCSPRASAVGVRVEHGGLGPGRGRQRHIAAPIFPTPMIPMVWLMVVEPRPLASVPARLDPCAWF
jgi:hypothetical protein